MKELHKPQFQWDGRKILHMDMDCFFAAVEILDNPRLRGYPVIVGGTKERGVVCAASYEARAFGVRSAMPTKTAHGLCPKAVFISPRMQRYAQISSEIFEIFQRASELVQPLSIDEAFLDVTQNHWNMEKATLVAKTLQRTIEQEVGITASAGVAPNKFLAKIASGMNKPNGLKVIAPDQVESFIKVLKVEEIWGVGRATAKRLHELGVYTCLDLQRQDPDFLVQRFGKYGYELWQLAFGIDSRPVKKERKRKSLGRERTFAEDIVDFDQIVSEIKKLNGMVNHTLRKKEWLARTIHLKVKYSDFSLCTRSQTLDQPVNCEEKFWSILTSLIDKTDVREKPVRLLGVSLSHLVADDEKTLFQLMNL